MNFDTIKLDPNNYKKIIFDISVKRMQKAFDARLAYEQNCIDKYDRPFGQASRPIPRSEQMQAYAQKYGTTEAEMKTALPQVEQRLENDNKYRLI